MNTRSSNEGNANTSLIDMLEYKRPHASRTERKFIGRYIWPLGARPDKFGNYFYRIGEAPVLWSCHTDTVHTSGGFQKLKRVGNFGIGVASSDPSNCLGADDTAGVWLMYEMIRAQVPGLYIFHRDEEHGCNGSRWIAENTPKILEGIKFAIALDRRNKDDIITFQGGNRCCSNEFAKSLAAQLDMGYSPSPNGSYTDTKQYTDLIPECTNISVGYTGAHSSSEQLDAEFLVVLRDKLLNLNVENLVEKRVKGSTESRYESNRSYYGDYSYNDTGGHNYTGGTTSWRKWDDPYATFIGWWDGSSVFHQYADYTEWKKSLIDEFGYMGWFSHPELDDNKPDNWGRYPEPPDYVIRSDKEVRENRRKWWRTVWTKKTKLPTVYRPRTTTMEPAPSHTGSGWFARALKQQQIADAKKNQNLGVTKLSPAARGKNSKERTQELRNTTAQADEEFVNHRVDNSSHGFNLEKLCRNHPEAVASYLEEYGVGAEEVATYILDTGTPLKMH